MRQADLKILLSNTLWNSSGVAVAFQLFTYFYWWYSFLKKTINQSTFVKFLQAIAIFLETGELKLQVISCWKWIFPVKVILSYAQKNIILRPPKSVSLFVVLLSCPYIGSLSSSTANQRAAKTNCYAELQFQNFIS